MEKKKFAFVLALLDRHYSGLSQVKLDQALKIFAKFALQGALQKMDKLDPVRRIPIEDCSLVFSSAEKSATLSISTSANHEKLLASAVAEVYKDLLSQIDQYGIDALIAAGRKAYGYI
jgi:hypothetical protein